MSNLVHVIKIETADCSSLSGMTIVQPDKCHFSSLLDFEEIPIIGLVGVKIEDTYDNNQKVYTTTVTFNTPERAAGYWKRKCFRLTSANKDVHIVGTSSRPYPIIKEENTFPDKASDTTLKKVTVTWKSLYPLLNVEE